MKELYQTRKPIPWINTTMEDVPHYDISDDWFQFERVTTNTLYFISWDTGKIVVKDEEITYFMIKDTETNKKTYWYVNKVNKVLSTGIEVEVKMDMYMSYGKYFLKTISSKDTRALVERATLTTNMFFKNEELRNIVYYAFKLDDELISNSITSYNELKYVSQYTDIQFPYPARMIKFNGDDRVFGHFDWRNNQQENNGFERNYGLYVVMITKDGRYHCYPISKRFGFLRNEYGQNESYSAYNSLEDIFKYIVNGFTNADNTTNTYHNKSFLGIYKGPVFHHYFKEYNPSFPNADLVMYGFEVPIKQTNAGCFYFELNPTKPFPITVPYWINFTPQHYLISVYINSLEPIMWAKNEIIPAKYFSQFNIKKQRLDIVFNLMFLNEFIGVPKPNQFITEDLMIGFGTQLPSATGEYYTHLRAIEQTYNTGLANSVWGAVMGLPAAIGKGAANPVWGATALVNTAATLGRDFMNLQMNKKHALTGAGQTRINSSSTNWYYVSQFLELLSTVPYLTTDFTPIPGTSNPRPIIDSAYVKKFSQYQRDQLTFILERYGFLINNVIPFDIYMSLAENNQIYVKFNDVWVASQVDSTLPLEVQENLVRLFSNGIRMHKEYR